MAEPIYGSTFQEDFAARRRMLPQAVGASASLTDEVGGLPAARARQRRLEEQLAAIESQEPDLSAMQDFARQQGEMGQGALLNALAAQYAGESFQPLQTKFLRRAEAAQQPLRVGTTMITPTGEVMRDPFAERERNLGNLGRRVDRAAGDVRLIETMQERIKADRDRQQERLDARAAQDERDRQLRLAIAQMTAAGRGGAGARGGQESATPREIPAPAASSIISPNINLTTAMGARGVAENALSRLANMAGGGDPESSNRQASAQLDALATQTRATLTAAFPGRSSVELLRQLERHVIKPNDLFTGVASVPSKAAANIAMLEDARDRLRQSITLNMKPPQRAQVEQNLMRTETLINDYKTLLGAAGKQTTTAAPQIAPRGQPAAATGGRLTPAEEQELAALRARFGKQP
jgi:hypothetical protein